MVTTQRMLMKGLYSPDPRTRWESVRDLGAHAASKDETGARDLVRRLAWSLNDESGATGWGAPEAMGEILARRPELRSEFVPKLLSYLDHEDVFLGNEVLDAGAIWALGRLGPATEELAGHDLAALLEGFLENGGALVRGAVVWTAGRLRIAGLSGRVAGVREDGDTAPLLIDGRVEVRSVGEWASQALGLLGR